MRRYVWMTFLAVLILSGGSTAQAQNRRGTGEVSLFTGWENFEVAGIEDGFLYGLRLGYNVTHHVEFEGYFDQIPTEDIVGLDLEFDVNSYGLDFLWNWGGHRRTHVPYLLAGLGHAFTRGDLDDDYDFWTAAAGYRYFFNEIIAFRFEVRMLGTNGSGDIGTDNFDTKLTGAISWVFGGD